MTLLFLLFLIPISSCKVQYLLTGYNYAEVCCDITTITAVELTDGTKSTIYTSGSTVPTVVSPPVLDSVPISDLTFDSTAKVQPCSHGNEPTCTESVTHVKVKLTEDKGFAIGHWYVVCFNSDTGNHCTLFRPCDCECIENAWLQMNFKLTALRHKPTSWGTDLSIFSHTVYPGKSAPIEVPKKWINWRTRIANSTMYENATYPSRSSVTQLGFPHQSRGFLGGQRISMTSRYQYNQTGTTTTAIGFEMNLQFEFQVDHIPSPYKMTNYVQKFDIRSLMFSQLVNKDETIRPIRIGLVGNPVNVGVINFEEVGRVCRQATRM